MTDAVQRLTAALADRYRIERELGQGGMATVYLALDLKHNRKVAVKVLRPELAAVLGPERFLREIETTANLRHPHILPLYDSGTAGVEAESPSRRVAEFLFYVMPFVEGESLRDRLTRDRQLPIDEALRLTREVADALGYAHGRGIIHRDIKPDNILLERGHAVVADFGIARAVSSAGADKLTQTGMAVGTPAYMSPEQSVGESDLDARSDLYSLGCVLYEMLAGEPPYSGPTAQAIIAKRFREPVPRISTLRETVPPALEAALNRVLAKSPSDRFATAEEFAAELRDPTGAVSTPTRAASAQPRHPAPPTEALRTEGAERFWVAVLPFKYTGANADLTALAEGLSEGIVSGLSRFSYLRVIARGSTQRYLNEVADVRTVGKELGARYVMEGNLRLAGSVLRVSVQLADASSGAQLWAETYDRAFSPEAVFDLQDELVPRIVSSVADAHGILPHSLSEAFRSKDPDQLSPYEAVLRSFGYGYRMTPEEHAAVRACLERAVQQAPGYADAWGMLSLLYTEEFSNGFNARPDPLGRALQAARRAADAAPSSALASNALARALFFRKEFPAFRIAADRAIELNPMNGPTLAGLGGMIAYAGDWERGCVIVERAARLNPRHPGGYWFALFYNAYRQGDYRGALAAGLKINLPDFFATHEALAAVYGQLGEHDAAAKSLRDLLRLKPDYAVTARAELGKWFDRDLVEHQIDGLRMAGLDVALVSGSGSPAPAADASSPPGSGAVRTDEGFWVAVLPFKAQSADPELAAFADGLGEDITTGLSRFSHLSIISRNSALQFAGRSLDVRAVGRELGAHYALEGAVRKAGSALRVSIQLLDASTGAHLWAESYDRELAGAGIFALQDDITDRVVATVADPYSVLVRSMAVAVRDRPLEELTASELVLRFFAYWHQIRPDEHARLRTALEQRLEREPAHPDAWACLARLYSHEHEHRLNPLPDSVERARKAARRAIEIDPTCQMGWESLADASYFARDLGTFHSAAARAMALNPRNTNTVASMAVLISMAGEVDRGAELARRAISLNPHHPGWYHAPLVFDHFRKEEYEEALQATKRMNMPEFFWTHLLTVAACGRLGRGDETRAALEQLRSLFPGYREELRRYQAAIAMDPGIWEQLVQGLAKAEAAAL